MGNRRSKFFGFPVVFESHWSKTFEVTCGDEINQIAPRLLLLLSIGSSRSWTLSIPACCWIRTLSWSDAIAETKQIRNCFFRGSGGSTPHDSEVLGSNPTGCWTLLNPISSVSLIQVPQGGAIQLIFLLKIKECLAVRNKLIKHS